MFNDSPAVPTAPGAEGLKARAAARRKAPEPTAADILANAERIDDERLAADKAQEEPTPKARRRRAATAQASAAPPSDGASSSSSTPELPKARSTKRGSGGDASASGTSATTGKAPKASGKGSKKTGKKSSTASGTPGGQAKAPSQTSLPGTEEQDVLPSRPLKIERITMDLAAFPENLGVTPDPALINSVRTYGVLLPIVVAERANPGGSTLVIRDGRRRIIAARLAGHTTIEAEKVFEDDGTSDGIQFVREETAAAMELALHATRRANFLSELDAINKLTDWYRSLGTPEPTIPGRIHRVTGMSVAEIRQRQRMTGLHPAIQEGLRGGKVSIAAARAALKLPKPAQLRVATKLLEGEVVTQREVDLERRAQTNAVAQELPFKELQTLSLEDLMRTNSQTPPEGTNQPTPNSSSPVAAEQWPASRAASPSSPSSGGEVVGAGQVSAPGLFEAAVQNGLSERALKLPVDVLNVFAELISDGKGSKVVEVPSSAFGGDGAVKLRFKVQVTAKP